MLRNIEHSSQFSSGYGRMKFSDLLHFRPLQLGFVVSHATARLWKFLAVLAYHIGMIISMSAYKQVLWINAIWNVATMANVHTFWDWSIVKNPSKTMGENRSFASSTLLNLTIPKTDRVSFPENATSFSRGLVCECTEPFFDSFADSNGSKIWVFVKENGWSANLVIRLKTAILVLHSKFFLLCQTSATSIARGHLPPFYTPIPKDTNT